SQRRDVEDGLDDPRDQVPILSDMNWNHRLNVQEVKHVIMLRACGEVEIILERHADEISHRVLRLLHQLFLAGFLIARLLWFRSLGGQRDEQKKNAKKKTHRGDAEDTEKKSLK